MPRQLDGTFTLVPGNPVVPGTTIEAGWANTTLPDIAQGLSTSLDTGGSNAMTAPLTLEAAAPIADRSAASKKYVDDKTASSITGKANVNGDNVTTLSTWNINVLGNAATATNATNAASATNATSAAVAGYSKQIPVVANTPNMIAAHAGQCVDLTAGMTITNAVMAAGDAVSLYNDTAAPITLTQGGTMVLRINGAATGANRTIAAYSMVTVWFKDAATAVVTGAVT